MRHPSAVTSIGVLLVLVTAAAGLGMKAGSRISAAPNSKVYVVKGKPKKVGYMRVHRIVVPPGKCLRVTNTNVLAERHSGGMPDAGEFTVMVGDIGESSLETGNGVAYQGSGMRNVTLLPGQRLDIGYWLRVGRDAKNYFYSVSVRGTMFRCR